MSVDLFWLDAGRGYVPLDRFPLVLLGLREASPDVFAQLHPSEPPMMRDARRMAREG